MKKILLDEDGQPVNLELNYLRNKEKAIFALRGILIGVLADNKLTESEITFIDAWLKKAEILESYGDRVDLLHVISSAMKNGKFSKSEIAEIEDSITDVIEYGAQTNFGIEREINELLGILEGIIADSIITDAEINHLQAWLNTNKKFSSQWPGSLIAKRITEISKDGKIEENERTSLLEVLRGITGHKISESGVIDSLAAEFWASDIDNFDHDKKKICFTGKFITGTRKKVQNLAAEQGAIIVESITRDLDVLIIGSLASRDWRFTSYGRKIEAALKPNENREKVIILSERQWLQLL